uniref:hypothetical protein n=1 Tax=Pseudomonas sp. TaxID=306 RepID=UPI003FD8F673
KSTLCPAAWVICARKMPRHGVGGWGRAGTTPPGAPACLLADMALADFGLRYTGRTGINRALFRLIREDYCGFS